MRSFICSAVIIATILIGQQWVVKSSEAQGLGPAPLVTGVAR